MTTPRTSGALVGSLVLAACWANPSEKGDYVDPPMTTSGTTSTSEPTTSTTTTHGPTSVTTVDTSTEDTTESDTSTSKPASCGDGIVDIGEMCDDPQGNKEPAEAMTGECTTACMLAGCGDKEKNADEECDDPQGNKDPADAKRGECTTACKPADCGDAEINADEDCEDGNTNDSDGCSHCFAPRVVFITSLSYKGNLGGVDGADSECQARADAATISGTFNAWISGPSDSEPAMNFPGDIFKGQYVLTTDPPKLVAQGWAGLKSDPLVNAITYDEFGVLQNDFYVWTNTKNDGTRLGMDNCGDWGSTVGAGALGTANITVKDEKWTNNSMTGLCGLKANLYCFQTGQ